MWYVVDEGGSRKIPLLPERQYIIGRKDCDIILESDQSISRRHASITVARADASESQVSELPSATLADLSKFGTQVNDENLNGTSRTLRTGDVLTFGQYKIILRVLFEPMEVTTSCLDGAAKRALQTALRGLGVRLVKDWQARSTTHLVMSRITVTPKTVCCLIEQRPIVTLEFFAKFLKACEERQPPPSVESCSPELTDSQVNPLTVSFKPNPVRATIFSGKKFIFVQRREFALLSHVIELAGGRCLLMEGRPRPPADASELVSAGSVVVHADERDPTLSLETRQWVVEARRLLKRHDRRMVQEAEIGYAVLYGSTDCYCNPDREAGRQMFLSMSQSVTSTQQPLVAETQSTVPERSLPLQSRTMCEEKSTLTVMVVPNSVASSSDDQPSNLPSASKKEHEGGVGSRRSSRACTIVAATADGPSSPPVAVGRSGHAAGVAPAATIESPAACSFVGATSGATGEALPVDSGPRMAAAAKCIAAAAYRPTPLPPAGHVEPVAPTDACATPVTAAGRRQPAAEAAAAFEGAQLRANAASPEANAARMELAPRGADVVRSAKRARSPSPIAEPHPADSDASAASLLNARLPSAPLVSVKREAVEEASGSWIGHSRQPRADPLDPFRPRSAAATGESRPRRPADECPRPGLGGGSCAASATGGCGTSGGELAAESDAGGGINVLVESLVRQAVPPTQLPVPDRTSAGLVLWNGKWVKNFKRFVKCGQRELDHLPRIIGGGDLMGAASLKRVRHDDSSMEDGGGTPPKQPAASARQRSGGTVDAAATGRGLTLASDDDNDDDDDVQVSSQQSRVNAIFDKFAIR